MYSHTSRRSALRIVLVFTICAALLPLANISLLVQSKAQQHGSARSGTPRPGKPEGSFPDLADVQRASQIERKLPAPVASLDELASPAVDWSDDCDPVVWPLVPPAAALMMMSANCAGSVNRPSVLMVN